MDAVSLLKDDHQLVERLFRQYESLPEDSADQRRDIVRELIRELSIHASIEEKVLYPGVREALPDGDSLAEEALAEHREAKEALSDLDRMDPGDPGFDSKVRSLIGDVRHHVEEEESEMLPKLQSAISKDRLEDMGRAMVEAKGLAPTRPHPRAPDSPPANVIAGPVAGAVDRVRDAVSGRTKGSATSPSRGSATRRPAGKRAAQTSPRRKKSAARKTSGRGLVIHVTPDERSGGWRAERVGSNRAVARGDRKADVVKKARDSAKRAGGRLVIHTSSGRIQEERTYGFDPRRSRG